MYKRFSDKIALVGMGMMVTGLDKAQALKILQQANPEDIQKALKQHAVELKSGKEVFEAIKTAAIDFKSILLALALLAPAAMATPDGTDTMSLQLRKAPLNIETITTIEKEQETKAKQSLKEDVKSIKDTIVTNKDDSPARGTVQLGGKTYIYNTVGQAKVIREIVKLDKKMKGLENAGTVTPEEHTKTVADLLKDARIPTR
jgi:hypothetical protein